jgi:hypothetical protein
MISDAFNKIMELQKHYSATKNAQMDERGFLVEKVIPDWLKINSTEINSEGSIHDLDFDGAHQMGNNSRVPYIRLFSRSKSPRAPIGWYCVFLFDEVGQSVYLTLGHGSTDPENGGRVRTEDEMQRLKAWGRSKFPPIDSIDARLVSRIDLKGGARTLGRAYEKTTLFAYKYDFNNFPEDLELIEDLKNMISSPSFLYEAEDKDPTLPGSVTPESEVAEEAIFQAAGRRSYRRRYGGPRLTGSEIKAIESWAVMQSIAFLRTQGWASIEDVGATESFDLYCQRNEEKLFVEVKGTQSHGEKVVLKRNEVKLHRKEYPNNALIVVKGIILERGELPTATGGELIVIMPWTIEESDLDPIGFDYTVNPHQALK